MNLDRHVTAHVDLFKHLVARRRRERRGDAQLLRRVHVGDGPAGRFLPADHRARLPGARRCRSARFDLARPAGRARARSSAPRCSDRRGRERRHLRRRPDRGRARSLHRPCRRPRSRTTCSPRSAITASSTAAAGAPRSIPRCATSSAPTGNSTPLEALSARPLTAAAAQVAATEARRGGSMASSGKVIITCAVTGSIHTPTMTPASAAHAGRDRRAGDRRGRGGRRDPPSPRARSQGRAADARSRRLHAVPAAHQAGDRRGHQHHHRRRPRHDPRGAARGAAAGHARDVLAQHGLDEFRPLPDARTATRSASTTGSRSISRASRDFIFRNTFKDIERILKELGEAHGTRFEFECYDVGHLYNLAHFLDRKLVKPPLFVQTIFGILGGIGADPENLAAYEAHRRQAVRRRLSLVDPRRRAPSDAASSRWARSWAAMSASGSRTALSRQGPARQVAMPSRCAASARILENLSLEIATPDEAREMLALKGGDGVAF